MFHRLIKSTLFLSAISMMAANSSGVGMSAVEGAKKFYAQKGEAVTIRVYNSEDYIAEEDDPETPENENLIEAFQEYCLEEYGQKVIVIYDCFDTNETMLAQLKLGKEYDLVCPSDYVIQKMINDDLIVPYGEGSTPNYDKYVSRFVTEKMNGIEVNGKTGVVNQYARGYMWGTLGILYNDNYGLLPVKGITAKEMDADMMSWESLWNPKYENLLAIKDSIRDTYATGIFHTRNEDFTLNGVNYDGLSTLKNKYDAGVIDADEYNKKLTEIFNMCDNETLEAVKKDLVELKQNAFGFEVDSGKVDMAQGNKFAINIAWSGDASWAMDMADEYNQAHQNQETGEYEDGFVPTILKYSIPETGANIWFDGWVMPKSVNNKPENKIWAERFVDFLSRPENAAMNMNYIGYTPVIGGDAILDLVQEWYDIRYDEEKGEINESFLADYEIVDANKIPSLYYNDDGTVNENLSSLAYAKNIAYFFQGTLEEHDISDAVFYISGDSYARQFDTQYPDETLLPTLAVMADFGTQTQALITMWEQVKNTALPLWVYILIVVLILVTILSVVLYKVRVYQVHKRRKERKKEREMKVKTVSGK
jgi:hypothetical protein